MNTQELIAGLFRTITEQMRLPEGYEWAPLAATVAIAAAGLMLLLRGARWAPGLSAATFLVIGGVGGKLLATQLGTPHWPTVGVVGILGGIVGVLFFRLWQASVLALCLMIAGFGVYFVHTLTPAIATWVSPEPADSSQITLAPAGSVVGDGAPGVTAKLGSLWSHLSANVPNFQTTFWAVIGSTCIAGLVFGLLLPRASRALWAASVGTVLLGVGGVGLMKQFTPETLTWLKSNNTWAWTIVGGVWLASFLYNFMTVRRKRRAAAAEVEPAPAKQKLATA